MPYLKCDTNPDLIIHILIYPSLSPVSGDTHAHPQSQPFTSLPLSQSLSTAHPSIITSEETSYSIQTHNQRDTHKNILSSTRWPKTSYDVAIISVSILRCWHLNNYNYSLSTLLRQMRLDVATYPKFLQRTEHQRGPQHNACNWGGIQKHPETWIPAITQQYNYSNHL